MSKLLVAPLEALTDPLLTDPERRVLLALFSFRSRGCTTVWPSAAEIAGRANVKDVTWISKLTKGLCEKGWIEKKKRGFTGGNEYKFLNPDRLSNLDSQSNLDLDCQPNLDSQSKMDPDTLSNLDPQSKSKLDQDSKYKEQTIEHTNEQTITKKIIKKISPLDYSAWGEPDQQIFNDWIALRKSKRAKITQTVIDGFTSEFRKAEPFGFTVTDCLRCAVVAGWQGFKFEWMKNQMGASHAANQQSPGAGAVTRKQPFADTVRSQARQLLADIDSQAGDSGVYTFR